MEFFTLFCFVLFCFYTFCFVLFCTLCSRRAQSKAKQNNLKYLKKCTVLSAHKMPAGKKAYFSLGRPGPEYASGLSLTIHPRLLLTLTTHSLLATHSHSVLTKPTRACISCCSTCHCASTPPPSAGTLIPHTGSGGALAVDAATFPAQRAASRQHSRAVVVSRLFFRRLQRRGPRGNATAWSESSLDSWPQTPARSLRSRVAL